MLSTWFMTVDNDLAWSRYLSKVMFAKFPHYKVFFLKDFIQVWTHGYLFYTLDYISVVCYLLCCWTVFPVWALGGIFSLTSVFLWLILITADVCVLAFPYFLLLQDALVHVYIPYCRPRICQFFFQKSWFITWRMISVNKTCVLEDHLCFYSSPNMSFRAHVNIFNWRYKPHFFP